jgi:O-antigen/teichoic acid export membrane protein
MVFGHLSLLLLSAHARLARLVWITLGGAAVRVALLALLIPTFGLTGAALGAAVAVMLEQALTVATALRLFGVSPRRLAVCAGRPVLATAAMAGVLAAAGPGWSDDPGLPGLAEACGAGAAVYAAALLGSWVLAGRPDGAEADVLALLRRMAG